MSIITKLAEEAANQVVAATSGKKKKKRGSPAWLLAPAGLGAAAGLGGAYALGSDQHAKDIEQAIGQHGTALEPNETYLSRYANMLSPGANTKIMGKPIGDLLALGRSSPTVLKAFGADPTYAASNPGSWHDAKAHYSMFAQGPIAAYAHMMHPNKMMNRAEYNVDIGDGKKAPYTEVMNKKFQEHWNKFRDPNSGYAGLKGNASWLEPHDVSTDMVPYADQVKFLKDFHAGLPPELRKIKEQAENDPTEKKMPDGTVWKGTKPALEQNLSNYIPITRGALKARNIMKNVGITSAGAGVGGLLGHYLHGALADEESPSTLGYLASTLGGAGLGGAASYFGGTEQGRKTMSDAAAKLMSLMQKKSAAAKMCSCCKKAPCQCPPDCGCGCKSKMAAAKPGLWANIHAKKERGAAPAKPGDKDYPDAKNWKKVTEESEKKAGLFYKNLDEPIATVLGDESGEGLASMRTQAPRLLTRLLSNPTTDAQAVLSHLAKHKPESLRPAQRPEDHVSNDYGAALQQLFPSRYRDPRADELFATLGTRLSSEKRPRYKQDVEAMQKNFAPMAHQRYSSPDDKVIVNDLFDRLKEHYPDRKTKTKVTQKSEKKASPAWQTSEGKSESGGLNDKGRASLKAQGHDIKRPQPEGGPRKDSFCARMKGMKSKLTSDETANDPDSRINKALRKWKCGSAQEKWAALATLALSSNAPTLGSVVQGPKDEKGHGIKFQFGTASNPSFLR